MKIGIYAGSIPPPVFIKNLVNGLANKEDKVFVYGKALDQNYQFSNSNIIQRKSPTAKFGVIFYSIYYHLRLIIITPYTFITIIQSIYQYSNNYKQYFYRSCRVLPPLIDKLDIFHIQWAKVLVQYPEFVEKIKCPIILSLRGAHINYSPLVDKELAQGYKKYFPMVKRFHAVSNAIAREAEKYAAEPRNIVVIHPAVNQELRNVEPKNNKHQKLLNIISVGRCHWNKGYTLAMDTMAILKKEAVQFHYTIIASGIDTENIFYQINDLDLIDHVTFINGLKHEKVIKKVSESDLFILPSFVEGISNAVLEAMSLGVPVISTECGGIGEVIRNGNNGFLVPVRDPNSMARAIRNFIDLDEIQKMAVINNARKTIINNYLLSHQIDLFKSLYSSIA